MLSIGRLGVTGGAAYYLDKVANNVDDYYLGRGEAPGQWIGVATGQLGLSGQVCPEALSNLLAGLAPGGQSLGLRLRADRRPGYDLTFSAPKGVSLLWAFGPGEVHDAVSAAHDRAVTAVLDQLSTQACYARRGHNGKQLVEARGFIGAAFRHRTSRAGDPQLHTHVVVPNLVQGLDGAWSAPDGRHLFAWAKTAGTLYQSALRAELAPLGLAWRVQRNGLGELAGIPRSILRAFSTRRVDIETAMEKKGLGSARSVRIVTLATRANKPPATLGDDVLRAHWREQLGAIELPDGPEGWRQATIDDVTAALHATRAVRPDAKDIEAVFSVLLGEHGVSLDDWEIDESRATETGALGTRVMPATLLGSTFSRRDAIAAVARAFDVTPKDAVALTAALLARDSVVRVVPDPEVGIEKIRTRGGQVVPSTSGDRRYTTTELLAAEERICRSVLARVNDGTGRVDSACLEAVLSHHRHLDGEQTEGLRRLLTSGNGYDLVIGQAGTGKSTMLAAARCGWEQAGYQVIGTAVAARTAAGLQAGTGIPSSSLTQLLADLSEAGGLTSTSVVVLDEASMVGTRALDKLCSHIDAASAKLVLVGDNRQLSSIDAGGALRTLGGALSDQVVTLTTNRRQAGADQQWERDALSHLRDGNVVPAVAAYVRHGRITIEESLDAARARLVADWWALHVTPGTSDHTTAILAVRKSDVAALNEMVHARLKAAGELGDEVAIGAKTFGVGDRVIFEKNQRVSEVLRGETRAGPNRLSLRNGTFATVVGACGQPGQDHRGTPVTRADDVPLTQGDILSADEATRASRGDRTEPDQSGASVQTRLALVVELDDGRRAVLPPSYVECSTSLGYALTVFRSQGITVDHTLALGGDALFQEAGYTQLSRGRLSNHLYVTAPENPRWAIGHLTGDLDQRDALQSLVDALSQSREQTMAHDRLPTWPATTPGDLDAVFRRHASLGRWIAEHVPRTVTSQLVDGDFRLFDPSGVAASLPGGGERPGELVAAQRESEAWITDHRLQIEAWSRLDRELRCHEYRLGHAASYSQPDHTTALLGPLPDASSAVERWQCAAGAIAAYRIRWGIDTTDALGPLPATPEHSAHWQWVLGTIESSGFGVPDGPEGVVDQTWLSSQWDRLEALDTAWSETARSTRGRDVTSLPEPPPFSWHRDHDAERDLGEGFGR